MQAQISFYDLNLKSSEKILDNVIKFPAKKSTKMSEIKKFDKPKPTPADSVKTLEEIEKIKKYFLDRQEYRNYCLFIIGITTGYRISDLLSLKFSDFFEDYDYLEKYGETYYRPLEGARLTEGTASIRAGYLEMANVQVVSEMVNLISITRAYESNQKIIQTYDGSLDIAVNQLGRIQ